MRTGHPATHKHRWVFSPSFVVFGMQLFPSACNWSIQFSSTVSEHTPPRHPPASNFAHFHIDDSQGMFPNSWGVFPALVIRVSRAQSSLERRVQIGRACKFRDAARAVESATDIAKGTNAPRKFQFWKRKAKEMLLWTAPQLSWH